MGGKKGREMIKGRLGFRFRSSIQFIATRPFLSSTLRITYVSVERNLVAMT